jgi:hypothetical protein
MIGYILTDTEKESIQGKEYAPYQFFNCVQDINGVWYTFLTDEDKVIIASNQYAWILDLPQGEFVAPVPPPFPKVK